MTEMISADLAKIGSIVVAALLRQPPFLQVLAVTIIALLVVMTIEGFRTSFIAIWRGHRGTPSLASAPRPQAALAPFAAPFAPAPAKAFAAKPPRKRKPLTANRKAFRSPRPTIRRHPAPFTVFAHSPAPTVAYATAPGIESV